MEKITTFSITTHPAPLISVSVISHGQIHLVENLLHDLARHCRLSSFELILTLNREEILPFSEDGFPFPVNIIRNAAPKGFAANNNQAFRLACGQFFCAMNPDIRLDEDPFPALLECLQDPSVGIAAPLVVNERGLMEDSARRFPTPFKILCKAFGGCKGGDYPVRDQIIYPDWVGGMFMLFPCERFKHVDGFDERFFLYYEDVDICARLRLQGYEVAMCPGARVIHQAHRSSHHDFNYFKWHLASMMRFFASAVFFKVFCRAIKKKF